MTNDLVTDQRVHKVCLFLETNGFQVTLVGRKQRKSLPLPKRRYKTSRMFLLFEKGPLFYAEYNIRLFLFLLFHRSGLIVSNDLDTLAACWTAARLKGNDLVYDTHEYYCGTPELVNRPFVRKFWHRIEKRIFPKLKNVITVNKSIARLYEQEYKRKVHVVRNIPMKNHQMTTPSRKELGMPENKTIFLFQGAGINIDRGVEELIEAMPFTDPDIVLYIIGAGDVIDQLKMRVSKLKLQHKVIFIPKVPFEQLMQYTQLADFGLTVDKDTNINYRFSLPNKLFDYIHAGIPVIASRLPEIESVIKHYNIGTFIENHDPHHLAKIMNTASQDSRQINIWKHNLKKASEELTWEHESATLKTIYEPFK